MIASADFMIAPHLVDILHSRVSLDHLIVVIASVVSDQFHFDDVSRASDEIGLETIATRLGEEAAC